MNLASLIIGQLFADLHYCISCGRNMIRLEMTSHFFCSFKLCTYRLNPSCTQIIIKRVITNYIADSCVDKRDSIEAGDFDRVVVCATNSSRCINMFIYLGYQFATMANDDSYIRGWAKSPLLE